MTLLQFNIKMKKLPSSYEKRKKRYVGLGDPKDYILASFKKKAIKKQKPVIQQPKQNYRNELSRITETSI